MKCQNYFLYGKKYSLLPNELLTFETTNFKNLNCTESCIVYICSVNWFCVQLYCKLVFLYSCTANWFLYSCTDCIITAIFKFYKSEITSELMTAIFKLYISVITKLIHYFSISDYLKSIWQKTFGSNTNI